MVMRQNAVASGYFRPYLSFRVLPACPGCGERHPLAYQPPQDRPDCPRCGRNVAHPGHRIDVPAIFTGPIGPLAALLLRIGQALSRLRRRL